jgi:hypothetical protein
MIALRNPEPCGGFGLNEEALKAQSLQVRRKGLPEEVRKWHGCPEEVQLFDHCSNGVDTVFGLPGVQIYSLFDALYEARHIKDLNQAHGISFTPNE